MQQNPWAFSSNSVVGSGVFDAGRNHDALIDCHLARLETGGGGRVTLEFTFTEVVKVGFGCYFY